MCTELYVDKFLVYSNCSPAPSAPSPEPSPAPSVPSPVPSPVSPAPSPVSQVPSPVPSPVSPVPHASAPSSMNTPATSVTADGYSLTTPSIIAMTKTTMSPSSSNSSMPFGSSAPHFIEDSYIVVMAIAIPIIVMCALVFTKSPRKCNQNRKVQPDTLPTLTETL